MKSSKEVGDVGAVEADRWAVARQKSARARATALGELAIEKAKLSRRVEALEESNARLEELAGGVTHDLSEGLATISLFVDALEHKLGSEIDPDTARDLSGIRAGLERMNQLVIAELESVGIGSRSGPVDSGSALDEALLNLGSRIARTNAEIVVDRMPWVTCDHTGLTRLFQNLLANSLAAKSPARDLRIRISARRVGLRWRFDVEDTGVGIPPHLTGDLPESASGADPRHGRGLVICRRIVAAHGGRIRAARRAVGGTTVSFDLPAGNEPGAGKRVLSPIRR